jgi:hypothetical protein
MDLCESSVALSRCGGARHLAGNCSVRAGSLLLLFAAVVPLPRRISDPRSFVNTPGNFVTAAYVLHGSVLFDAAVALENADLTIQGPTAATHAPWISGALLAR